MSHAMIVIAVNLQITTLIRFSRRQADLTSRQFKTLHFLNLIVLIAMIAIGLPLSIYIKIVLLAIIASSTTALVCLDPRSAKVLKTSPRKRDGFAASKTRTRNDNSASLRAWINDLGNER